MLFTFSAGQGLFTNTGPSSGRLSPSLSVTSAGAGEIWAHGLVAFTDHRARWCRRNGAVACCHFSLHLLVSSLGQSLRLPLSSCLFGAPGTACSTARPLSVLGPRLPGRCGQRSPFPL